MNQRLEAGSTLPLNRAILEAADEAELRFIQRMRVKMAVRFEGPLYDDLVQASRAELKAYELIDKNDQVQAAIDWAAILEVLIPLLLELFGLNSRRSIRGG